MSNSASAIKSAEAALDKGDYSFCLEILDPLLVSFSTKTSLGAHIRLLAITAYIGKGEEQKAINICQTLTTHKEANVRQQAQQLLSILDAPYLPRPSNWSVEIPKLEMEPSINSSFRQPKDKKEKKHHPPTGPTKNLDFGFSIITLFIILLLTFFLSGCVDITTNLRVTGADRLDISLDIESISGKSIPWQVEFAENLAKEHSVLKIQTKENYQHFESPTIRFEEVNKLLTQIVSAASKSTGLSIDKPQIISNDRNWIIGTRQDLRVYFDLRQLPKIPGLKLNLIMHDLGKKNNLKTTPLEATFKKGSTLLALEIGQVNKLEVSYWKWNKISIGIILIVSVTLISKLLQSFRLKMGFGFPELPP